MMEFILLVIVHPILIQIKKTYPPTAQNVIKQGEVVAKNIISAINDKENKIKFDYKIKGMMTEIGKKLVLLPYSGSKSMAS